MYNVTLKTNGREDWHYKNKEVGDIFLDTTAVLLAFEANVDEVDFVL